MSWDGACAGSGDCEFEAAPGLHLTATFHEPEVDECAGLIPDRGVGAPVVVKVSPDERHYCNDLAVDGLGNIAVGTSGFGPFLTRVFSPGGRRIGGYSGASAVQPRSSGFIGLTYGERSWNEYHVAAWSPEGVLANKPLLPGRKSRIHPAVTGGSVVVSTADDGCSLAADGTSVTIIQRVSDDGTIDSAVDVGGEGCPGAVAWSDSSNNTLVLKTTGYEGALGFPPDRNLARWLSADGRSLTPWFDLGPTRAAELAPLIGGGFALGDWNGWYAMLPSGSAELQEPPAFLEGLERHSVSIIGGGRGYAAYPPLEDWWSRDRRLELFAPSGRHCASVALGTKGHQVAIGRDGTVATSEQDDVSSNSCTVTWWKGLLK